MVWEIGTGESFTLNYPLWGQQTITLHATDPLTNQEMTTRIQVNATFGGTWKFHYSWESGEEDIVYQFHSDGSVTSEGSSFGAGTWDNGSWVAGTGGFSLYFTVPYANHDMYKNIEHGAGGLDTEQNIIRDIVVRKNFNYYVGWFNFEDGGCTATKISD